MTYNYGKWWHLPYNEIKASTGNDYQKQLINMKILIYPNKDSTMFRSFNVLNCILIF